MSPTHRALRMRPTGFTEPCLPSPAKTPPTGANRLHEIKHDGFRTVARRDASSVRPYTRNGNDFATRFSRVVAATAALPASSCLIDGEAIVTDDAGLADFKLLPSWRHDAAVVLWTCSNLTPGICAGAQSRSAKRTLAVRCPDRTRASHSTSITSATAISFISRPASSAARALCRSDSVHPTAPAESNIGSRSKNRWRRQQSAKRKRIGLKPWAYAEVLMTYSQ
jgi:ATP dependent DNA ligase domain